MRALRFIAPAFALFLVAGEAHAAAPSPGEASASASVGGGAGSARRTSAMGGNRFRLHVDGEFFGFSHVNPDGGPEDDGVNAVGFGVGRGLTTHVADGGFFGVGTSTPLMGIGFGVLILDNRAIVGARTGMSLTSASGEADNSGSVTGFGGELLPYFRYMFLDGPIRPFVEGHFGFGGALNKASDDPPGGETSSVTSHTIAPIVGAAGGAMFFLNEHFSIDLGLNFDYMAPHTRTTYSDNLMQENTDWDKAADQVSLTVNTGISGWF